MSIRNTSGESRYAVCRVGNGFTVEDRQSGQRIGNIFRSWESAELARKKLAEDFRNELRKQRDQE